MTVATITTDVNIGPFKIPSNGQNMIMNNYAERNNLVVELVIPEPMMSNALETVQWLHKENKLSKDCLVITPGSDGGIRLCFELFVKPKDKIITLSPTFAMVDIYAKIFEANQFKINYDEKLRLNISDILELLS